MKQIESLSELNKDEAYAVWTNAQVLHEALRDFLDNSLTTVLDDYGFELIRLNTRPGDFIEGDMKIESWGKFVTEDVWDANFQWFGLGVGMNNGPEEVVFYAWLTLSDEFDSAFFKHNDNAKAMKEKMESMGWTYELDEDDEWSIHKSNPYDSIDLTKPSWKKDLKRFYEETLVELTETIFMTKNWIK